MERLILPKTYPKNFIYNYIPKIVKKLAIKRLSLYSQSRMSRYLSTNYRISIGDIIKLLDKIRIDEYKNFYILHYDIIDTFPQNSKIKIREVFHLVSYGNRDVKGTHAIDSTFDYIAGNIHSIYSMYVLEQSMLIQLRKQGKDLKIKWQ